MKENKITEEELLKRISLLNNNNEINKIAEEIKSKALDMGAYLVEYRVKSEKSALESFKNNKKEASVSKDLYRTIGMTNPDTVKSFENVDTVVDLLALRIITNTADEMYKIAECLNHKYKSFLVIDLINNPLIGFEYRAIHMYFKISVKDIDFEIPMEIQFKTYEMHHAWIGLHDTIYKNQKINLYDGSNLLPTLFKIFEFNAKILKNIFLNHNVKADFSAIDCIIAYNKKLFSKYQFEIEKSCFLLAKSIYYDKNKNTDISEAYLLKRFEELKLENTNNNYSPLHLCGNRSIEYATYCIATGEF